MTMMSPHTLQFAFHPRPHRPPLRGIRVSKNPESMSSSSPMLVILFRSNSNPIFCGGFHRPQVRQYLVGLSQSKETSDSNVSIAASFRLPTASEVVRDFYDGINRRDLESVESLIGMECVYEDLIFSKPFVGRKLDSWLVGFCLLVVDVGTVEAWTRGVSIVKCGPESDSPVATMEFFKKFTESISSELQFVIDDISSEDTSSAGVTWHLEWRGRPFPFSKGCSFYRLEVSDGTRKIVYARDCVEPAVKPGSAALDIISAVTWLLQRFPQLADRL